MVFREMIFNPLKNKNGYLYLRENIYVRDKRTLKRKPKKLGDGTYNPNNYKKKKETYCGKIIPIIHQPKLITFQDYLKQEHNINYLDFKLTKGFLEILNKFVKYILFIYDLDEKDFFEGKKKVYDINEKLLSRETINWLSKFEFVNSPDNPKEMERFLNRCEAIGIFDEEIQNLLYLKITPELEKEDFEKLFEEDIEIEKIKADNLKEFIGGNYHK